MPGGDASGRGSELVRMFGIDAAFDGVAAKLDVALLERQFFVGCNAYLLLHDVDTCDHFCHRMFHLHASVHLDEIKLAVFIQEFECSRAAITDLAASFGTAFADLVAHFWIEQRCRRFLNDLLVTALHRTIALAQIHRIAVLVGEHLKLDMARVFQKFFHVYHGIVESGLRLGAGHGDGIQQGCLGMHHTHAASAAAAGSLDDDRVSDAARNLDNLRGVVRQGTLDSRHTGHPGFLHGDLGAYLVTHQTNGLGARTDKYKAALLNALGKIGVFRKKTIARMDGLRICNFRCTDDGGDIQITLCRRGGADTNRLVGEFYILGIGIRLGMHHDGFYAHLAAGALNTQRYFTAIGNQDFFKHLLPPR